MRVNLSAPEILKLAEQIIANSKKVHNSVATVPLDKVRRFDLYTALNTDLIVLYLIISNLIYLLNY